MTQRDQDQPTFEDLEVLAEASQLLTLVDLDRVIHEVIALVSKAVGAQKTSLFLLQNGSQIDWGHLITMRNLSSDQTVKVVEQVLEDGFAGWVFRHGRGDIITDTETDERWIVFEDDPIITRSAMCVPFIYGDTVIAMVTLIHEEPQHFRPYHLRLMEIIANQTVVAIRNAQLVNHLNEQRRQLNAVLQSIGDVLLVVNKSGQIVMLNEAALPLLDVETQDEVLGQSLAEFTMVDDVFDPIIAVLQDDHSTSVADDNHWRFEVRSERRQIDFQVRVSLWGIDDDLLGYVIVMHNVTKLHDLSRFKDEMLRVASHDLRSPLALVAGWVDMIRMDLPDPDSPIHEYIETIKEQIERMSNLVDDLLRVERIRSSPLELHEETDMAALVKLVLVNSRPLAAAKNISFREDIQLAGVPPLVADRVLIRQAMENLIANAIKYTPPHGTVFVMSYYDDTRFHFVVEDNGIGIPENDQPFVFESFYRVQSAKTTVKGSGLGLSLVKNVIARHDGEVWLRSEPDVGSRFGFWLPLYRDLPLKSAPPDDQFRIDRANKPDPPQFFD